ncbi:hypothetical protein [Nocardia yunnanensis]|uniref:hypothetical protein n=1 Tax=Nocardia yunnanensis TaxID=2382165 RepID=UPI00319DC535
MRMRPQLRRPPHPLSSHSPASVVSGVNTTTTPANTTFNHANRRRAAGHTADTTTRTAVNGANTTTA